MKRIPITDEMRATMCLDIPPSCAWCGDDLDIHAWIEVDDSGEIPEIVNCDRAS